MILFSFQIQQLDEAADTIAGSLDGVKMGLFQVPLVIDKNLTLADVVAAKATYATYVKQVVVWRDPSVGDDGDVDVQAEALFWTPTDSVTPNSIYGLWIEDSGAAKLYFCGLFDNPPLPMNSPLDQITVVVVYKPASNSIAVVIS